MPLNAGSGSNVVEDLPSRRPHSVVAVIGHPLATSGQFQMATNRRWPRPHRLPSSNQLSYAASGVLVAVPQLGSATGLFARM